MEAAITLERGECGGGFGKVALHAADHDRVVLELTGRGASAPVRSAEIVTFCLVVVRRDVGPDLLLVEVKVILACDGRIRLFDLPAYVADSYRITVQKRIEGAAGQIETELADGPDRGSAIVSAIHIDYRFPVTTIVDRASEVPDAAEEGDNDDNE